MKVMVVLKITETAITYGKAYSTQTIILENVTSIDYVDNSNDEKVYRISHKTGSDAEIHNTDFLARSYMISIMEG